MGRRKKQEEEKAGIVTDPLLLFCGARC
jgi:hypothetical protein